MSARGRPRLLDAFCCAGGAAVGYHRAGFEVVGVDHVDQPNYPFQFIKGDALEVLREHHAITFQAIHASPPCQLFSHYQRANKNAKKHLNLIPETRELLEASGLPYVIENVEGSPLLDPVLLCGSMFDLDIKRHRLFETNWDLEPPVWPCRHKIWGPDRYPGGRSKERTGSSRGLVRGTVEVGSWDIAVPVQEEAMGIDWMTPAELSQAVPPVFTELIGGQLMSLVAA